MNEKQFEKRALVWFFVAILGFVGIFFLSCQNNDKIIGTWERYGDGLAGMRIEVVKEGNHIKGTIILEGDNELSPFVVGDVKWKNIKKTTINKYEFEDLYKQGISTNITETRYNLASIELVSENEIYIRQFARGNEFIGTEQKWERVK